MALATLLAANALACGVEPRKMDILARHESVRASSDPQYSASRKWRHKSEASFFGTPQRVGLKSATKRRRNKDLIYERRAVLPQKSVNSKPVAILGLLCGLLLRHVASLVVLLYHPFSKSA